MKQSTEAIVMQTEIKTNESVIVVITFVIRYNAV